MSTLSEAEKIGLEDEWPHWPYLPIKRRVEGGGWPELALLAAPSMQASKCVVLKVLLWAEKEAYESAERVTYETVDELLADGWVVD